MGRRVPPWNGGLAGGGLESKLLRFRRSAESSPITLINDPNMAAIAPPVVASLASAYLAPQRDPSLAAAWKSGTGRWFCLWIRMG